jgi:molybdopterin synthase catalytic subunit
MSDIRIQSAPLDPATEAQVLRAGNPRIGAVVTFLGLMRDLNEGERVEAMTLEHYPGMTEKALAAIVTEARARWDLEGVRVVHRVGELRPEEPIVLVAVASLHRGDAFRACEFIIDYLKTRAPFWKKERTANGERWVAARDTDTAAESRWLETAGVPKKRPAEAGRTEE